MLHTFTDATFEAEVLKSDVPVLVDYWAPWCGPCKVIGPIVAQVAQELEGKPFKIGKVNVDENPEAPSKAGVLGIPALIVYRDGQPVQMFIGVQPKEVLFRALGAA